jgi:hypothetical protein
MRMEFMQHCLNFEDYFLEKVLWFDTTKQMQAKLGFPCWLLRQARSLLQATNPEVLKFRKLYSEYYYGDNEQPPHHSTLFPVQ